MSISFGGPEAEAWPEFVCSQAIVTPLMQTALVCSTCKIDVAGVVGAAGYIHSGGVLVVADSWQNLDGDKVINECRSRDYGSSKLIWFTKSYVSNQGYRDSPILGLAIDDKRYHLGNKPFRRESDRIQIALATDTDPQGVLYAYRDVSTNHGTEGQSYLNYPERNEQDWLIIYDTKAKKENPVHELDENNERKLFWAGIFTTPHRLVNAMLNLAGVENNSVVVDPFAHTGTVAIEAAQFNATVKSFDLSEVIGAKDNFEFLCTEHGVNMLDSLDRTVQDDSLAVKLARLAEAETQINSLGLPDISEENRLEQLMTREEGRLLQDQPTRLLYWMIRRSILDAKRGDESSRHQKYMEFICETIKELRNALDKMRTIRRHIEIGRSDRLCLVPSLHLDDANPSPRVYLSHLVDSQTRKGYSFEIEDITDGLTCIEDESIDAVVTDPPYGYGDDLDYENLRKIWVCFIETSLRILRDGGALVFCALDKVKTGRPVRRLLTTEHIIGILNRAACAQGISFSHPSIDPVAEQSNGIFYWKSPKALNRSIFAVRIHRQKKHKED